MRSAIPVVPVHLSVVRQHSRRSDCLDDFPPNAAVIGKLKGLVVNAQHRTTNQSSGMLLTLFHKRANVKRLLDIMEK